MRLLECRPDGGFAVTENLPDNENLKYAILSHTWESEEVTFEDLIHILGLLFIAGHARKVPHV